MLIESFIGASALILIALVGFFFRREREFGTMQAKLKAAHGRLDRIEKYMNGESNE